MIIIKHPLQGHVRVLFHHRIKEKIRKSINPGCTGSRSIHVLHYDNFNDLFLNTEMLKLISIVQYVHIVIFVALKVIYADLKNHCVHIL